MHRMPARRPRLIENTPQRGLLSRQGRGRGPAVTVKNLFSDLKTIDQSEVIAEHPERRLQGVRVHLQRTEGHGTWELYRLGEELYVVVQQGLYDSPRRETIPGEGLIAIHLHLSGHCEWASPGCQSRVTVTAPQLVILYQPMDVPCVSTVQPGIRDASVSLYCRPEYVANRVGTAAGSPWPALDDIARSTPDAMWHRQLGLSPTLSYIAKSLLDCPYPHSLRLLHAEAKALEILVEVLATMQPTPPTHSVASDSDDRQLDAIRRSISDNMSAAISLGAIAKKFGISESKLKRTFKARFGVTVFDYSVECRMRHALELLRCKRMSVGQVAHAVGYRHQTSFAAAFERFFGFLPRQARNGLN